MEKRADWIKEIYVDQADNLNKLKAQTDVTDSKVLTGISQIQYEIPGFVDFHLHAGGLILIMMIRKREVAWM